MRFTNGRQVTRTWRDAGAPRANAGRPLVLVARAGTRRATRARLRPLARTRWSLLQPESLERVAVERRARAQRDRQAQMRPRLAPPPEPLEALAQGEMRRSARTDRPRAAPRTSPRAGSCLAGVEVRPPERLEDRALARLEPVCALEDDRGLGVMPPVEQRLAALEQLVGAFGSSSSGASSGREDSHGPMVARTAREPPSDAQARASALAVRRQVHGLQPGRIGQPGIRPRLAIGCAVDLLDVAGEVDRRRAADVRADRVRIDRRAGLLEVARSGRA